MTTPTPRPEGAGRFGNPCTERILIGGNFSHCLGTEICLRRARLAQGIPFTIEHGDCAREIRQQPEPPTKSPNTP